MSITSIFGIKSGFDSASLVQKLIALQARPLELKMAQLEAKETELEVFQSLRTQLQAFQSTLQTMNTASRFSVNSAEFTVTAGTGNVLSVSTTSSASVGTYDITVNTLAQETTLLSDTGFTATTDLAFAGAGLTYHVDIDIGGTLTTLNLNATDTIQNVVDTINASGLDVTASIIDDGGAVDPLKIVIRGNTSGTANAVTAELWHTNPAGLGHNTEVTFTETQTATDASVTVDGINYTRTTNSISGIITGVTLDLESTGSGTLIISSDTTEISANIEDFVAAYNKLIAFIDEQTEFNPETFATGTLFGNTAVQGLETTLRRIATGQVTGLTGNYEFLSQIGITTQDDGTLFIDDVKLDGALTTDLNNVIELFTSPNGIVTQLDGELDVLLDSSRQGPLTSELDSLTESIDDLNETLLRMDDRLELFERNIRNQFINLEIILGQLDAQRSAFQQALQNLGSAFDRQG